MGFGLMSVGASASATLATDRTLTREGVSADAKAVGEALARYLPLTGGTLGGNVTFAGNQNGAAGVRFNESASGPGLRFETAVDGKRVLVVELGASESNVLQLRKNGVVKSWFDANGTFYGNVTGKATTAGTADNANAVTWGNVSGKPTLAIGGTESGTMSTSSSDYHRYHGYLRFTDGTQIYWFQLGYSNGNEAMYGSLTTTITFLVPFVNAEYMILAGSDSYPTTSESSLSSVTSTKLELKIKWGRPYLNLLILGRWK